jgi:hypothetical protein
LEAVPFQKTAQNRMLPITSLAGFLPQTVSVAKRPSIAQIRIPEVEFTRLSLCRGTSHGRKATGFLDRPKVKYIQAQAELIRKNKSIASTGLCSQWLKTDRALTCWATFSGPPDPDCCLECRNYPILQYALRSHQYFLKWETGASFLDQKSYARESPKMGNKCYFGTLHSCQ